MFLGQHFFYSAVFCKFVQQSELLRGNNSFLLSPHSWPGARGRLRSRCVLSGLSKPLLAWVVGGLPLLSMCS